MIKDGIIKDGITYEVRNCPKKKLAYTWSRCDGCAFKDPNVARYCNGHSACEVFSGIGGTERQVIFKRVRSTSSQRQELQDTP